MLKDKKRRCEYFPEPFRKRERNKKSERGSDSEHFRPNRVGSALFAQAEGVAPRFKDEEHICQLAQRQEHI